MPLKFRKQIISNESVESANVWDVNGDGVLDIVSGMFWYQGPDFKKFHYIGPLTSIGEYWNDFSTLPLDINGDGQLDFVSGGWGGDFHWKECPPGAKGEWKKHPLGEIGHIETTRMIDIDGDGIPEIIPNTPGSPMQIFKLITDANGKGTGKFARHVVNTGMQGHGMGFGDINGDGRMDILLDKGWLEQPADPYSGKEWVFHPEFDLGHAPSIPVLYVDLDGAGKMAMIVGRAHHYGLDWYEPITGTDGKRTWKQHPIDPFCSQYHDLIWCDIDGDGKNELVTGKRYRAHCGSDPGEFDDLGLYYFKWTGEGFVKQVIAHGPLGVGKGVGIHFAVADLRGTGRLDVIAPGKDGLAVFFNEGL